MTDGDEQIMANVSVLSFKQTRKLLNASRSQLKHTRDRNTEIDIQRAGPREEPHKTGARTGQMVARGLHWSQRDGGTVTSCPRHLLQ